MIRASAVALALLASTAGLAAAQGYGEGDRYTNGGPSYGSTGGYGEGARTGSARAADNDFVADVQLALREQGYGVRDVTGILDAETRAAIRAYQRDAGLAVTGEPDRRMLAALQGSNARRGTADRGNPRREGLGFEIEQRLQDKGFAVGPVDGEIDPQTTAAIRRYQELRGFQVTGEPSRQLLADLRASNATAGQATPRTPEGLADNLLRGLGRQFQQPGQ